MIRFIFKLLIYLSLKFYLHVKGHQRSKHTGRSKWSGQGCRLWHGKTCKLRDDNCPVSILSAFKLNELLAMNIRS